MKVAKLEDNDTGRLRVLRYVDRGRFDIDCQSDPRALLLNVLDLKQNQRMIGIYHFGPPLQKAAW